MKLNRRSIGFIIQKYFILFIVGVITLLWVFEVVLLNPIYKEVKIREIQNIAQNLKNESYEYYEDIGLGSNSLIVLYEDGGLEKYYGPKKMGFLQTLEYQFYLEELKVGQEKTITATITSVDPSKEPMEEKIVVLVKVTEKHMYAVYTMIRPPESIIQTNQYIIILTSILLLVYSVIISTVINKKISKPIMELNDNAKKIKDNIDATTFKGQGYHEIEELTQTLNEMREAISKVDMLRNELIGNVSHDLKTPLTMIGGYAEMMKDIPMERNEENLDIVIEETRYLTSLVNDLLDMSSLQNELIEIIPENTEIRSIAEKIITRFKAYYPERSLKLEAKEEIELLTDPKLFQQILYNLINNAIQHTDTDILVRITEDKEYHKIEVIDYGKGMDEEVLKTIWERYYSTKLDHQRSKGNSGLGLSIVRNIFQKMSYPYGVQSEENMGSIFWFKIPK